MLCRCLLVPFESWYLIVFFKGLHHLHKVTFKIVFFCFFWVKMIKSFCCMTTGFWCYHAAFQVIGWILALAPTHLFHQLMPAVALRLGTCLLDKSHSAHALDMFVPFSLFTLNYLSINSHSLPPREFCFLQVSLSALCDYLCYSSPLFLICVYLKCSNHTMLKKAWPPGF